MVQTTQAASIPMFPMVAQPNTSAKSAKTSDAVFSLGKQPKADSPKGRGVKDQHGAQDMALVACAIAQQIVAQDGSAMDQDVQNEATGLAQQLQEAVGNLEGNQKLNGEMLAAWLSSRLAEAQQGDGKAESWLQALLARMPEGEEWNLEALTQFFNENVEQVQSAPYPLETTNDHEANVETAMPLSGAQRLTLLPDEIKDKPDQPQTDIVAPVVAERETQGQVKTGRETAGQQDSKADMPKQEAHKTSAANADEPKAQHIPQTNPFVAPTPQTAPDTNVALQQADIATQVTDALFQAASAGKDSLSIQMKPDFLGNLSIQLTLGKEGLIAKIRTESPEVQQAIASQLNELTNALRARGVDVVSMDVVHTQLSQYRDMPQGHSEQPAGKKKPAYVVERVEAGLQAGDGWLDTAMIAAGEPGGSVEYSA